MTTLKTLPLTAATTPIDLAAYLIANGVKVVGKPTPITDVEDGEIVLSERLHVQVGEGYALLTEDEGDGEEYTVTHGEMRYDGRDVLTDIQAKLRQKP